MKLEFWRWRRVSFYRALTCHVPPINSRRKDIKNGTNFLHRDRGGPNHLVCSFSRSTAVGSTQYARYNSVNIESLTSVTFQFHHLNELVQIFPVRRDAFRIGRVPIALHVLDLLIFAGTSFCLLIAD